MSAPDCRKIREGLSAYLEGDLDPAETSAIRAHLEQCADCRAELELQRLTIGALRCLPDLPPPAGILAGVRARLEPEPWYRRLAGGRRWLLGVPVGAVATVLVVIGVSFFQSRFTETEKMGAPAPLPTYPQPAATAVPPAPQVPAAPAVRTAPPVPAAPVAPFAAVAPERKDDRPAAPAPAPAPAPVPAPIPAPAPIPSAGGDLAARLAPIAEAPRSAAVADQVAAPAAPAAQPAPTVPTEPAAAPAPTEPMALGKVESRVDKPLPPAAAFADKSAKDANEQFQRQKVAAAPSLEAAAPEPQAAAPGALSLDDRVARQPERALVPRDRDFAAREESDAKARAVPAPQLKKEAAAKSARVADRSDEFRSTAIGGERSTISMAIRIVCLLLPDGGTIDEIKRLLERAGAGEVKLEALAPSAIREAFAQHRGKPGLPREAAGGWDVTARVQAQGLTALLEELASRPGLRILEKPADITAAVDPTGLLELKLTVLQ